MSVSNPALSITEENYLKAIFSLQESNSGFISTNKLAERMGTAAASVTEMLKRLGEKEYVEYKPYSGAKLTTKGRRHTVMLVRRHRLWETFLFDKLNMSWAEVHEIAEELEHISSDNLISRLDDFLGNPEVDPHGDIIPDKFGNLRSANRKPLSDIPERTIYFIAGMRDANADFLALLDNLGLTIGDPVEIVSKASYDGSLKVNSGDAHFHITAEAGKNLLVTKTRPK